MLSGKTEPSLFNSTNKFINLGSLKSIEFSHEFLLAFTIFILLQITRIKFSFGHLFGDGNYFASLYFSFCQIEDYSVACMGIVIFLFLGLEFLIGRIMLIRLTTNYNDIVENLIHVFLQGASIESHLFCILTNLTSAMTLRP